MKSMLSEIYRDHHERGARYGYLYCNGARAPYLKRWIGTGKRVLDLGCRDGMLTTSYAAENEVVGVDVDREALALIQKKLSIETHWLDLNAEWPFPERSFDIVVACEILEHLYFPDQFLQQVAKTLNRNGQFIGSVPNAFRMRNRFKFLFGKEYESDPTHVRQFSCVKIEHTLKRFFSHVEIVPLEGKVLPFLPVSERLPSSVNRLFARDILWRAF